MEGGVVATEEGKGTCGTERENKTFRGQLTLQSAPQYLVQPDTEIHSLRLLVLSMHTEFDSTMYNF